MHSFASSLLIMHVHSPKIDLPYMYTYFLESSGLTKVIVFFSNKDKEYKNKNMIGFSDQWHFHC